MQRALLSAGVGVALLLAHACGGDGVTTPRSAGAIVGSHVIASESRAVSGFAAVTVTGPLRVILEQTGSESLVVTADDNVIPVVQLEVRGERLFLGFASNTSLTDTSPIVCHLTVREVRDVEASGAARLDMSGIDSPRLAVHLSGAASGTASGRAAELALDVLGASRWTAGELRSLSVVARVAGASYGLVHPGDSLVADVSGLSVLEYLGDPRVTRRSTV